MAAPISVTLKRDDPPVAVVSLVGEHDAYSATRLENELAVLVEEGVRVVVDLADATFIDSQTLSTLLSARHRAETLGLGFVVALPDGDYTQVHRILDLTGLGSAFAILRSIPDATAAARAGQNTGPHVRAA